MQRGTISASLDIEDVVKPRDIAEGFL